MLTDVVLLTFHDLEKLLYPSHCYFVVTPMFYIHIKLSVDVSQAYLGLTNDDILSFFKLHGRYSLPFYCLLYASQRYCCNLLMLK